MKYLIQFALIFNVFAISTAQAAEISLSEALKEAEANSPKLKSAAYQNKAAEQRVRDARSGYLPSVELAFIGSDGSPGSFSFLGVDNNISAADRIGEGGAATLRQTIWDFGRTSSSVKLANSEKDFQQTSAALSLAEVDLQILNLYLTCSFLKTATADAQFTAHQAQVIASETRNYVRSGQRSVIEKYLVDAQAKEAETLVAELGTRITNVEQRLTLMIGRDKNQKVQCPDLSNQETEILLLEKNTKNSPMLEVFRASANMARFQLEQAKADENPTFFGLVTGGYFNDIQKKDGWNYSAGIALTFPLFDGFHRDAQVERRKAEFESSKALINYSQQIVDEANSKYDEQMSSLKVRLNYLGAEVKLAKEAFGLARGRFFGFKGSMIDLRESLRNLNRVVLSVDEARRDLLIARGASAIYNGARSNQYEDPNH